jgi:hypothetical protein
MQMAITASSVAKYWKIGRRRDVGMDWSFQRKDTSRTTGVPQVCSAELKNARSLSRSRGQ